MSCGGQIENGKSAVCQCNARISIYPYSAVVGPTMSDALTHMFGQRGGMVKAKPVSLQKPSYTAHLKDMFSLSPISKPADIAIAPSNTEAI